MSTRTGRLLSWGLLVFVSACGGGSDPSTSPPPPPPPPITPSVASVEVTPATGTLEVGRTLLLVATPRDAQGYPLNKQVSWSTSNAAMASVSTTGLVSAVAAGGLVSISATSDGKVGSAAITVILNIARVALNYRVWLAITVPPTAPDVRAYLSDAMTRSGQSLTGVMLIGSIPRAYQYVVAHSANPNIPDTREEAISYQYYADLNGSFSASSGYISSGNHPYSYDVHGGNLNWEVWVGLLPLYQGSVAQTITAVNRYFDKNHAYRTGGPKPPRAFLQVNELNSASTSTEHDALLQGMRNGTYSWMPFSGSANAQFYFNSSAAGPALQPRLGRAGREGDDQQFRRHGKQPERLLRKERRDVYVVRRIVWRGPDVTRQRPTNPSMVDRSRVPFRHGDHTWRSDAPAAAVA